MTGAATSGFSLSGLALAALLSFIPVSELRGGIPLAIARGIPWYFAWPLCAFFNALVAPGCWIFLSTFHKLFLRFAWYEKLFSRFIERARERLRAGVEKWGWLGVAAFVAIPFPLTGAWTGTLGAWVLGLSRKKTMLAVVSGVITAGGIVSAAVMLGIKAAEIFIKKI